MPLFTRTLALIAAIGTLLLTPNLQARAAPAIILLAHGYGLPDDLAWGPRGSIYFVDFGNSSLNLLLPNGKRQVVLAHRDKPEGMVVLRDGTLLLAEQGPNRIVHVDPRRHTAVPLITIPNLTGLDGMDGITQDPRDGSLIIPDSPSGRILRVAISAAPGGKGSLRAGRVTVLAHGLGRPVDALVERDGTLVVVDENLYGAFIIDRHGNARQVGGYLSVPDDLADDGQGGFYVTCLGDGTVRHVDRQGNATLVASGLPDPQGLLRRADGTLIVAEEQPNRIVSIHP